MSDSSGSQLRLRVFAGPNGSVKSTVIKLVRETLVNGRYLDFGLYVNADDILSALKSGKFFFYRSLGLLREASGLAHQAFFFDNSIDNEPYKLEGHFKKVGGEKKWDEVDETKLSNWFKKYGWEE